MIEIGIVYTKISHEGLICCNCSYHSFPLVHKVQFFDPLSSYSIIPPLAARLTFNMCSEDFINGVVRKSLYTLWLMHFLLKLESKFVKSVLIKSRRKQLTKTRSTLLLTLATKCYEVKQVWVLYVNIMHAPKGPEQRYLSPTVADCRQWWLSCDRNLWPIIWDIWNL